MKCTDGREPMTQPVIIANFRGFARCVFFLLRKQLAENTTKSYHVYKVIGVPHIYNKSLGIRLAGYPANKNKSLILIKF